MHAAVISALRTVLDPELHRDLVSLGMVERAEVHSGVALVTVRLTTPACPLRATIEADVRRAVLALEGVQSAEVTFHARVAAPAQPPLPGVKNALLVGSGKGGVGKSSVAVNIAAALAQSGAAVGLLDADVYGPSAAQMLGKRERLGGKDGKMQPLEAHGVRFVSMANLAPEGQALVWRGPMLHSAVRQFLQDVHWGNLDYLIVDLPPGTGDVQLSITQNVAVTGALIVTTPQEVALIDARRAIDMLRKAGVPLLGVVENMSYFVAPDTGHTYDLFGRGGAAKLGLEVLGEVPLEIPLREGADAGIPAVIAQPTSAAAQALTAVAEALAGQISVHNLAQLAPLPLA